MSKEISVKIELEKAIRDNNLVLFVGAGCSMPLKFPSWKELIEIILIDFIDQYGEVSDINFQNILKGVKDSSKTLFDALNKIESDIDNGTTYKIKAKEIINIQIEKKSENLPLESLIHNLLWTISEKIITTNYDKVIEKYIPREISPKIFDNTNAYQGLNSQKSDAKFLYKIHGDYENPESIILFESDYKDIYKNDNYNNDTLSTHFKGKTILFVGFSLSDPFVNGLFTKIKSIYNGHTVNKHFIFTTKNEDFTKYDITPIKIDNWDESLIEYLNELKKIKLDSSTDKLVLPLNENSNDELTKDDVSSIVSLIDIKTMELLSNPSNKELISEVKDLRKKLDILLFGKIDYLQEVDKQHRNNDLQILFDIIYSSEKLDSQTIEQIYSVRNSKDKYNWYDRSVIVSAITCSLIHFNKADEKKITLLIDFINDNEEKVWQKALSSLFIILNHLGNKWLRLESLKNKISSLNQNLKIQNACSIIVKLYSVGLNNVSMINENLFENNYFKGNPFNYFLPYHKEENPEFDKVYETYEGDDIEDYISAIDNIPIPDQLKYLLCNKSNLKKNKSKGKISDEFLEVINLNSLFYPFSIYIQELISFYRYFPIYKHEEKLKYQLRLTETPLKDYLLNAKQKYSALGMHFMHEKKWAQAIFNYKEVVKLDDNEISDLLNLANCYGNNDEKNNEYNLRIKIQSKDPENEINLTALFHIYIEEKKDYKKSLDIANKLITINSKNVNYFYFRGLVYEELKEYDKALNDYQEAIKIDSKAISCYTSRASIFYIKGEYEKSNKELDIAISIENKECEHYIERATNFMLLSLFDKALEDLKTAESFNSKLEFVYNAYANFYRLQHQYDDAFKYVEKAKKIKKAYNFTGTLATIYSSMGDDDNFYKYLELAFIEGAKVELLYHDIKNKYRNEPKFIELLKKCNQSLFF